MVYLVGAGPGDPGLITRKGLELVRRCDALIYDYLGTAELLDETSPDCEKICVGKRAGSHSKRQEDIHAVLIAAARRYKTVVRLKGGDPFVFGRGGEEAAALQQAGVPFQVVPGVTSAVAVPERMGIPVTHRGCSRSVHIFTGHTKPGESDPYRHIRREEGSSVFLMGLSHLQEIIETLLEQGQAPETPVSVLAEGMMPNETRVTGTLSTIVDQVKQRELSAPAIIIVGETAAYNLVSQDLGSLSGKKIGVVGTEGLRAKMRMLLEERGASVYSLCNMRVVLTEWQGAFHQALNQIEDYQYVAFTSQNGVSIFFDEARKQGVDYRRFAHLRYAVVGSATKEALGREGFQADYMPREYTTEALARGLAERMQPGEALLLPRSRQGNEQMEQILHAQGIDVTVFPVYDVVGYRTGQWKFRNDFDAVTFASASGVEAFVRELGTECAAWESRRRERGMLVGAIGRVTAQALERHGIRADVVPAQCDVSHLIERMQQEWEA